MIHLHIQFNYRTTQLTTVNLNAVVHLSTNLAFEDPISVLGHSNNMVLAMPKHMR